MSTRITLVLGTVVLLWIAKLLPETDALPGGPLSYLAAYVGALLAWITVLIVLDEARLLSSTEPWSPRSLTFGVVVGLALFVVSGIGYIVSRQAFGLEPPDEAGLMPSGFGFRWVLMLGMVLGAAVLEEWTFRGVLLLDLLAGQPAWAAVLVSALVFGFYHLSVFQLLPTTLLGIGLGATVVALGSLRPAIVAHATFNLLGLILFTLGEGAGAAG